MLDHNEIQELLAGFALGELTDEQTAIVAEHISQCAPCKQQVDSIRLVLDCAGQMSKVSVDDDMCVSAKEGLLTSLSPEKTETAAAPISRTIRWRSIMQSKLTKFATAAVIILGVFLGIYMLQGSSVAWADLVEHVEQIKAVTYKMHMTMKGMPGCPPGKTMDMDQTITISSDYGMKVEMMMEGKVISRSYMLTTEESMISIMDTKKKYLRITLTDEIRDQMRKESNDPKQMIADFMDLDYVELGRKEINGIEVEGIEVNDPKLGGGVLSNCIGRLWVDIKTDLPVRIEIDFSSDKGMEVKGVIEHFDWGVEVTESDFAYEIPDDYEEMANIKMPEMNAETAIEGLKKLSEMNGGKFPNNLNMLDVMTDVSEFRMKKMKKERRARRKARREAIEEAKAAGIDPNTIPEDKPEEMTKEAKEEMMNEQLKMQGICMFYMHLVQGKKDPAYYGDRITPEDTDMVLMRWQNDNDGYTVIFGDLSSGDFTAEEVGEMEAKLPEPPAPEDPNEEAVKYEVELINTVPVETPE